MNFVPPRFSGMIWLRFLLTPSELQRLFDELNPHFVKIDKVTAEPIVSKEQVLKAYEEYWHQKETISPTFMRQNFQLAMTLSLEAIIQLPVEVAKAREPVVMMMPGKTGGLEACYPRIFQEGDTGIIHTTFPDKFPNTALFQKLQRWLRAHSLPQKGSLIRIGKEVKQD